MKTLFVKKNFIAAIAVIICCGICLGLLAGFTTSQATKINPNMPTIVIDAGHGGIDNGVVGINSKVDEADINLAIARHLKGNFIDANFNCVMTRTTEAGLYGTTEKGFKARDMKKRKQIITQSNPDVVISIHQNYCPLPSKRGGTVFYDKASKESERLAKIIQTELNELNTDIKPNEALVGDYYLLKCSQNPSIIVECGFLSNPNDDSLLTSEKYQKTIAYAIFKGTVSYLSANK